MYGRIFPEAFSGSMMGAGCDVFAVWTYALATADEKGCVELNPKLLSAQLGAPAETMQEAIDYLCQPDPDSRSKAEEGRRLVREGQFLFRVVNHAKYCGIRNREDRRRYQREWDRKNRPNRPKKANPTPPDTTRHDPTNPTHVTVTVDKPPYSPPKGTPGGEALATKDAEQRFDAFWSVWPKKVDKAEAKKVWLKLKPSEELTATIIAAVQQQKLTEQWSKANGKYIPGPAKWLRRKKWDDEVADPNTGGADDSQTPPPPVRDADGKTPRERILQGGQA
jgi:hypothetical protein